MKRNPGVDFARVVAIFLVVLLHIVFQGGSDAGEMDTLRRLGCRTLESLSIGCVDLFALISGYVGLYNKGQTPRRMLSLWLQVVVTGLTVTAGFAIFSTVGAKDWLSAVFPIITGEYWYVTGYALCILMMPLLDTALTTMPLRRARNGVLVVFAVVWVSSFFGLDPFTLKSGYCAGWIVLLYWLGSVVRLHFNSFKGRPLWWFIAALACVGVTISQRLVMSVCPPVERFFGNHWTLLSYLSPTAVLFAVFTLVGCAKMDFSSPLAQRLVRFYAPASFGVYLWHVHPLVFARLWPKTFAFFADVPSWVLIPAVLVTAGVVLTLLTLVERLRMLVMHPIRDRVLGKKS